MSGWWDRIVGTGEIRGKRILKRYLDLVVMHRMRRRR